MKAQVLVLILSTCLIPNQFSEIRGFFESLLQNVCICRCGIANHEARLLGGYYTGGFEFPWLATIQIDGVSDGVPATLISNRHVITSASRLIEKTPRQLKVTLARHDRCFFDVTSMNISVSSILIHEEFNQKNEAHNIALVKLAIFVKFDKYVSPICLSDPVRSYGNRVATVVGWSFHNNQSCRPRKVGLPNLKQSECKSADINLVTIDKGCLGVIGDTNPICKEDAGSPVMFQSPAGSYEVTGILIDQNECNDKPSMALYTKIDDHLSWIVENTKDACYCLKL